MDAHGVLHLLHRAGPSAAPVIVQLLTARAWAVMHTGVLQAACPSLRLEASGDRGGAPVMHAFTDHPKDVRGLLDTDVRLHLLAIADANAGQSNGQSDVWICRDLN